MIGTVTLTPKQEEFFFIPQTQTNGLDVACYLGGFGAGKTFCGSLLGISLCLKYAGIRGLVGAETFPMIKKSTYKAYMDHLSNFGFKEGRDYRFNVTDSVLTFNNGRSGWKDGSSIIFTHLAEPEKLKSLDLGFAEIEEASQISEASFNMLLSRMRQVSLCNGQKLPRRRIFMHTNPEMTKGWLYRRFVESPKPNYRIIFAKTTDNPHLDSDYIENMKAFGAEYYRINVLGEFGDFTSGLVTKGFSREVHLKPLEWDHSKPLHLTCDFNKDPMCWIIAQKDNHNVYIHDELVMETTTTQKATLEFIRRYPPDAYPNIIINGDSAGHQKTTKADYSDYNIMYNIMFEHGYKDVQVDVCPYNPSIEARVSSWNSMVLNANGDSRVFISDSGKVDDYEQWQYKCKWLIHNIENLKYKEGSGKIEEYSPDKVKTDPSKKFLNHPFAAISYLVYRYFPIVREYDYTPDYQHNPEDFDRFSDDDRFNLM